MADPSPNAFDPADQSANYNTPLTPAQEAAFQKWAKANPRLGNTYDYDARGFWLHGAKAAANGHGDDEWKKPNHPTFSTGSDYSGPYTPGGVWTQMPDGTYQFAATPQNLRYQDAGDLQNYFAHVEKGNRLILPPQAQP